MLLQFCLHHICARIELGLNTICNSVISSMPGRPRAAALASTPPLSLMAAAAAVVLLGHCRVKQQGMVVVSHIHQVRLSVCALCREQLRELHQMQEHAVEDHGREVLQAGTAEEPELDDR